MIKVLVSPYTNYEYEGKWIGGEKMSILIHAPKKLVTEVKHREPTTTSIVFISVAIFVAIIILMYSGLMYTETTMKHYSDCRNKIAEFEQSGMYVNSDQFKLALSYCNAG
jgi:hypothetical protein